MHYKLKTDKKRIVLFTLGVFLVPFLPYSVLIVSYIELIFMAAFRN